MPVKSKATAPLIILMLVTIAHAGFGQTKLFTYNTGVDYIEGESYSTSPYILGPASIGVTLESSDASNQNRFLVFDLKGNLQLTLLGSDLGWTQPSVVASPTGSFLLGGYNSNSETLSDDKLYVFNKKNKTWTPHPTIGKDVVWSSATAGNALASGIWAEIKNVGGKLVLSIYRF